MRNTQGRSCREICKFLPTYSKRGYGRYMVAGPARVQHVPQVLAIRAPWRCGAVCWDDIEDESAKNPWEKGSSLFQQETPTIRGSCSKQQLCSRYTVLQYRYSIRIPQRFRIVMNGRNVTRCPWAFTSSKHFWGWRLQRHPTMCMFAGMRTRHQCPSSPCSFTKIRNFENMLHTY